MAVQDRYRAQNCVLTISLLVSNNLKTIRKCLSQSNRCYSRYQANWWLLIR